MKYYTALDVSLRSVSICIIDDEGTVQFESKVSSDVDKIVTCLKHFSPEVTSVGFEAGTLTQHLTYGLQAAGYEVICLEARQVHGALSAMRNKTDKKDARGIAQILRTGWYSRVHVKSFESHIVRTLLSSRKVILSKCVDLENEIRGLLHLIGAKLPPRVKHEIFDTITRKLLESHDELSSALVPLLEARLALYNIYLQLDKQVKMLAKDDPVCKQLMSTPGVGKITALTYKSAVDDPTRFTKSRTVAAHFGLTPRRFQSGETDNPGRISKAGDPAVRAALYLAARSLIVRSGQWSELKAWGMKLVKTKGHRKAVTAVARKLAVILHKMWIEGTDFNYGSNDATA